MNVSTTVRHMITISVDGTHVFGSETCRCAERKAFEFTSRDVGCTQGTMILYRGRVIARFKPGTRHWHQALEVTQTLIQQAVEASFDQDGHFWFNDVLTHLNRLIEANPFCLPWDGSNPNEGDDDNLVTDFSV